MRILVTGGAGFIGSHVTDLLVASGHTVAVMDDLSTGSRSNLNEAAQFMAEDITLGESIQDPIAGFQPEAIIHLAAQVSVPHSFSDATFDARINISGTLNLLAAAGKLVKAPRFTFISSGGAVYGEALELPSSETTPPNPATPYGIAKLAGEQYVRLLSRGPFVILRFSNVYGPRQGASKETGVCAVFTGQAVAGQPLTVLGDGTQTRDYVFVEDVARAVAASLTSGDGEVINISSGRETPTGELARLVVAAAREGDIENLPPREGDVQRSWLSAAKARTVLGWEPTIELEQGLLRTLGSCRPTGNGGG